MEETKADVPKQAESEHKCDCTCHHVHTKALKPDEPNTSGDYFEPQKGATGPTGCNDGPTGPGTTGTSGSSGISGPPGDLELDPQTIRDMIARINPNDGVRVLKGAAAKHVRFKNQVASTEKVVGPNEKCPCKSGKKYKKCCMYK